MDNTIVALMVRLCDKFSLYKTMVEPKHQVEPDRILGAADKTPVFLITAQCSLSSGASAWPEGCLDGEALLTYARKTLWLLEEFFTLFLESRQHFFVIPDHAKVGPLVNRGIGITIDRHNGFGITAASHMLRRPRNGTGNV